MYGSPRGSFEVCCWPIDVSTVGLSSLSLPLGATEELAFSPAASIPWVGAGALLSCADGAVNGADEDIPRVRGYRPLRELIRTQESFPVRRQRVHGCLTVDTSHFTRFWLHR